MRTLALTASLYLLLVALTPVGAEVKVASVFGENMVLQRERPVPIWGTAAAEAKAKGARVAPVTGFIMVLATCATVEEVIAFVTNPNAPNDAQVAGEASSGRAAASLRLRQRE